MMPERKYGWYSWHAEEKNGSCVWLKPNGDYVIVTSITNTPKSSLDHDSLFLGEVTYRMGSSAQFRKPCHLSNLVRSQST